MNKRTLPTIDVEQRGEFPIEKNVSAELIAEASTSCTSCGSAGCHTAGCPMENAIPEINGAYQQAVSAELQGNHQQAQQYFRQAFDYSWQTNRWGLLTGRLCPSDQLCEGSCIYRDTKQGAILIRGIEYDTHQRAWQENWLPAIKQPAANGKSLGIIGSGFGAIAAAEMAVEQGYQVTIYERQPVAGGLGTIGIPRLKITYAEIEKYLTRLQNAGVKILTDHNIAGDNFASLAQQHDALIIATGKYQPKQALPNDKGGNHMRQAIDYLSCQSFNHLGLPHHYDSQTLNAKGKDVLVIGGGDTAMDCLRTAKTLQGATSSICLYRGAESNIRAGEKELQAAKDEGVAFEFNAQLECISEAGGRLQGTCIDGRQFSADMIISATGFDAEDLPTMFDDPQLPIDSYGLLAVTQAIFIPGTDPFDAGAGVPMAGFVKNYQTDERAVTVPIFAVGDIVGSSLAVHALAGGRDLIGLVDGKLTLRD